MGYLSQTSATPADTGKFSMSCWIRIPSATFDASPNHTVTLLDFGDATDTSGYTNYTSQVFVGSAAAPGASRGLNIIANSKGFMYDKACCDKTVTWATSLNVAMQGGAIAADVWQHVCCSLDVSGPVTMQLNGTSDPNVLAYHTGTMAVNNIDCSPQTIDDQHGNTVAAVNGLLPTQGPTQGGTIVSAGGDSVLFPETGPDYTYTGGGIPSVPPDCTDTISRTTGILTIDGWELAVNSFELAVPLRSDNVIHSPGPFHMAYMQAWFGTFIDFSNATNRLKFVTAAGKPPTDPFTAAKAFGNPDIYFYRNKIKKVQFYQNKGTCGSFTSVGSITDFSPGP